MAMTELEWDAFRFFRPEEFDHPEEMSPVLLRRLDMIRGMAGEAIHITSDFRPGDLRAHGKGVAVDISDNLEGKPVNSGWRYRVLNAAFATGVKRIGVYDRHIHLDVSRDLPDRVCWWGKSS